MCGWIEGGQQNSNVRVGEGCSFYGYAKCKIVCLAGLEKKKSCTGDLGSWIASCFEAKFTHSVYKL